MSYNRNAELSKLIFVLSKNGILNQKSQDKFANVVSNINFPSTINENELVPLSSIDTKSWSILDNCLICNYPGVWQIISQYQVVGINSVNSGDDATIEGWFNINLKDVENSAATGYVSKAGGSMVLTIALTYKFEKDDVLIFGVRSNSTNGNLNIACINSISNSGVNVPSFIATLSKIG